MSTFALDSNSSDEDKTSALNYVLSNLGNGGTQANTANVLTANVTTGVVSTQGQTVSYLYQYMNVAYANTAVGGDFSSNSANKLYYGIHNTTANIADANPADYQWTQVSGGGFGTTKSLYYQTLGGRQIFFNVATASPGYYFRPVQDNVAINLDDVTSTQTIYTAQVYRRGNVTPATPTGGTYNFGNLFLTPPTGWSANVPPADGNTYVFTSQNTFQSSQAFVVAPTKAWTFPTLFTANGAAGATGANGAPGTNGISTYDFNAYTLTTFFPNTPLVNSGSWNFATGTGTPPLDPNYMYAQFPNYGLPTSTITFNQTYNSNIVKIYSNTISNITYPTVTNTYYTLFANTYAVGNVIGTGEGNYTSTYGLSGNVYQDTFTVTGNTAYVDLMLIGAGGDGSYINSYYVPKNGSPYPTQPLLQEPAGGSAGSILIGSNIALPVGTYTVYHGAGANTVLFGPTGGSPVQLYRASAGNQGDLNGNANITSGTGASITFIGNSTTIAGNVGYPPTILWNWNGGQQDRGLAMSTAHHGGTGQADPWGEITWLGQYAGTYTWPNGTPWSGANVAYFAGGGGSSTDSYPAAGGYPAYTAQQSYGGLGAGGIGQIASSSPPYAGSGSFGTGAGGGGGRGNATGTNTHYQVNNGYYSNGYNSFGAPGALIIRQHNPIPNPPQIATWTLLNNQTPTPTATVYSSASLAFTTNANATVSTLAWQDTIQSSGYKGDAGPRGFVPMAYVATASDPTSYTTGQYTYAFSANRANVALPIGTGYVPTQGDVAQFVYTPTNTIVVKTYNSTANVWQAVNGQVISGNVFVTGSVNATALNANDVYTLNLRGGLGVVGNVNSPGFWMQASTGDARMAGNTSIGNNLTVGNNAVVGNNLTIGASASIGNNLIVGSSASIGNNLLVGNNAIVGSSMAIGNNLIIGLNAQVGANLNVGTNAVIGNNLSIGNNAIVGNNFGVGNTAVIGNNLTVGNNAIIGSSLAIGNNLNVGTNATIGANLNIGTNATIGNNLLVGNNAVVGASFGVGDNAVIGNNLTVGNNAIIGSSVAIGNNLNIGNNAVIGGNLTVVGLVTAGSLQANTVATTTMVPNSATATSGRQDAGYEITSPAQYYSGYDGTYYVYQTANLVPGGVSISATTNNVTNVISGYMDVYGTTTANGGTTIIPQMYVTLYRVIGANVTAVGGTFLTSPAANGYTGGPINTTQTLLPVRLSEVSIIDIFTVTPPQTVAYYWFFGSYINVSANVAPTQNYIGLTSYSISVTNYKR